VSFSGAGGQGGAGKGDGAARSSACFSWGTAHPSLVTLNNNNDDDDDKQQQQQQQ
jgi:hypothetical protein